ncbi:Stress response protein nst1 [Orbilia oligospora]|uniref:Stress response protein NST1 n=1 Tax=Orbilia oligospora TaxID=2813651 RepID=A0A7C8Q541_ORBOL|nr:Stress response protein nst1 [Orbilia oligospora]
MPGGHIFNKDGTRMIKVRSTPQTPSLETPPAHDTHSNGLPSEVVAGPNTTSGSKKKKKKNRNKGAAITHDSHLDPTNHNSHHDNHDHFEPSVQGPSNKISHPQAGPNTSRQHLQEYYDAIQASLDQFDSNDVDVEGDDYYSDDEPHLEPTEPSYDGASNQQPGELEVPTSKKNKKKKKKKGAGNQPAAQGEGSQAPSHETARKDAQKSSKDRIWNTSTSEERERIKNFWLSLGEDERRSLVKVEKEAVLKKMKEQQKHSCSCSVCGRKRTAIEEELEVLYDAYYEELEHPSKGLPQARRMEELPELEDDDEGPYDDDEDYEDISEDGHRSVQQDFFNFGNSLTVRVLLEEGGILTVADDLLKNDGKKFIEMMEQLAERRMAREEEASQHAHGINNQMHSGLQHNHSHVPNGNPDYDQEEDEEDYEEEDDEFEDEDDEEPDAMTEEQRMEEGRRMFQIFAARMFEQRVLSAYRERVAIERQKRLLEEEEDEKRKEIEQKERKLREKEKKSAKRKAQKEAKEAEMREKAEKKAREEAEKKAEEERKAEEARRRKEEQRLKREAEKKVADEERLRKEEEKKKRLQEEREREQERERKRKEQLEQEKKKKAEVARKQKEEKDLRDKEKREKDEKDRKDRELRKKVAEEKERARKEAEGNVAIPKIATTPILSPASKASITPSHSLHPPTIVPAVVSPRLAVATPALPKQTSPGKAKSSARGSVASSPQTPKVQARSSIGGSTALPQPSTPAALSTSSTPSLTSIIPTGPIGPPKQSQLPAGPPGLPLPGTPAPPGLSPQGTTPVGHIPPIGAPHGFPSHLSPPPGVPPPDNFPMLPGQGSFMPPGHRPHPIPLSMLPPPSQLGFGMNIFRGFPIPTGNPPLPLGPPSAGLRGFPPSNTRPFMGNDFSGLPQQLSAPGFPQAPGSPFMRPESIQPGHQRQPSGDHIESNSVSTPKPIHRPTPIQRPANAAPGGALLKANIDELSTSLGSSALLGDDEPEEPSLNKADGASPARRGSNVPGGRGVFGGMMPGSSPFFLGHDAGFGGFPSPSNTWGAPSPLFNPSGPWGPPALSPASTGWMPNPSTPFGANQRRTGRVDLIRVLAISNYKQTPKENKSSEGFMPLKLLMKQLNEHEQLAQPNDVGEEELLTITEVEGDWQNGGGVFLRHVDEHGISLKFLNDPDDLRRRVSSSAGLVGTPIGGPGEIGSPVVSASNTTLPFATRPGPAGTGAGVVGSPHF